MLRSKNKNNDKIKKLFVIQKSFSEKLIKCDYMHENGGM